MACYQQDVWRVLDGPYFARDAAAKRAVSLRVAERAFSSSVSSVGSSKWSGAVLETTVGREADVTEDLDHPIVLGQDIRFEDVNAVFPRCFDKDFKDVRPDAATLLAVFNGQGRLCSIAIDADIVSHAYDSLIRLLPFGCDNAETPSIVNLGKSPDVIVTDMRARMMKSKIPTAWTQSIRNQSAPEHPIGESDASAQTSRQ